MNIPDLQAPNNNEEDSNRHNKGSGTLLLIFTGIIICLILIIFILLLAPKSDTKKFPQGTDKPSSITANPKEVASTKIQAFENKAGFNENSQIEWLMVKTDAEKSQMNFWAEKDYKQARDAAKQAEQFKQEEKYQQAEAYFRQASEIINKVFTEKEIKKKELLKNAREAIEKGELEQAKQLIETARLIDPDSKQIQLAQQALNNRYDVDKLFSQAMENKKNNNHDAAIHDLEQAILIEPGNKTVKNELEALKDKKNQAELNKLINSILSAIESNDLAKARKVLEHAKTIKQNDTTIEELESRINDKSKRLTIKHLSTQVEQQENKEQWYQALTGIEKILAIDADTYGAKSSRQRIQTYIEINRELDNIIKKQKSFQNDKILQQSKTALEILKQELKQKKKIIHPLERTPKFREKLRLTEKIITQASIKIPVTIVSDNDTDIVVYKVGKFGKLIEKKINLRPGQYTFFGTREGYRDVRKKVTISPESGPRRITVKCLEKI